MRSTKRYPHQTARASRTNAALTAGLLLFGGCAVEQADSAEPSPDSVNDVGAATQGLRIGDRGAEVRFVHDYLYGYGYFPNDTIAEQHPEWRPLLAEAPADPEEFDDILEQGVRGFQQFNNLQVSGVVDAKTLALMQQPRCGEPDNFARPDDKFKIENLNLGEGACAVANVNNTKELTYRIEETDGNFVNAFVSALNEWQRLSSLRFRRVTSGGCIILKKRRALTSSDGGSGTIAVNLKTFSKSTNKIKLAEITVGTKTPGGSTLNFFFGQTPDSTKLSARVTLLHEIGHTFGIDHSGHVSIKGDFSGLDDAIMAASQANGDNSWFLTDDDAHGLHVKLGTATNDSLINGRTAKSMDVSLNGDLWEVDNTSSAENGSPIRCNGQTLFGAASHIAVDNTRAWHTNAFGEVYRNTFVGCGAVQWTRIPSDATLGYIAANNNEVVWALGKDVARNQQEHKIYRFNGSRFVEYGGFATRIAVDGGGVAWHVNQAGAVYFQDAARTGWAQVYGSGFENVHGGKNSFVWLITKGSHHTMVVNATYSRSNGVECTKWAPDCTTVTFPTVNFGNWSNMTDVFSDGSSKVYMREGFIPTDGGPEFGAGNLITFR